MDELLDTTAPPPCGRSHRLSSRRSAGSSFVKSKTGVIRHYYTGRLRRLDTGLRRYDGTDAP